MDPYWCTTTDPYRSLWDPEWDPDEPRQYLMGTNLMSTCGGALKIRIRGGTLYPGGIAGSKFLRPSGLPNPWVAIFTKKSACGKLDSSNRACQMPGWSFSPEKSDCGKLDSSNRDCQILGRSFSPKKGPAASRLAATGLVKVRIMVASWISATIR